MSFGEVIATFHSIVVHLMLGEGSFLTFMIKSFIYRGSIGFKTVCHLHVVGDSSFTCECDMYCF